MHTYLFTQAIKNNLAVLARIEHGNQLHGEGRESPLHSILLVKSHSICGGFFVPCSTICANHISSPPSIPLWTFYFHLGLFSPPTCEKNQPVDLGGPAILSSDDNDRGFIGRTEFLTTKNGPYRGLDRFRPTLFRYWNGNFMDCSNHLSRFIYFSPLRAVGARMWDWIYRFRSHVGNCESPPHQMIRQLIINTAIRKLIRT